MCQQAAIGAGSWWRTGMFSLYEGVLWVYNAFVSVERGVVTKILLEICGPHGVWNVRRMREPVEQGRISPNGIVSLVETVSVAPRVLKAVDLAERTPRGVDENRQSPEACQELK